jgi:O-antigen/teichoic acid export membrane protein
LFNVQSELAKAEAGPAMAAMVACFALAIPIGVVQRTQLGLQMGYMASLWQCVASMVGLAGVLLAVWTKASLPFLVLAYAGAPLLAGLANSLVFFGWQHRDLDLSARLASGEAVRTLAATGVLFLVLQVAGSVTYMSDNFIIAQKLGAAAVAGYAVPEKLFALIGMGIGLALAPLWPAYGEAISRGDHDWVRRILIRSIALAAGLATLGSTVLVIAAPVILHWWVGIAISPPFILLLGFGLWKIVDAIGNAIAMFLNGARIVLFQVSIALALMVTAVPMKLLMIDRLGVAGAVWATLLSYLLTVLFPIVAFRRRLFRMATNGAD